MILHTFYDIRVFCNGLNIYITSEFNAFICFILLVSSHFYQNNSFQHFLKGKSSGDVQPQVLLGKNYLSFTF